MLTELLAAGLVWEESGDYVGRASDGVVVRLGDTNDPANTDAYLETHPTPDTW